MNKFYKRLAILITLVLGISGAVIYFTVDINTLSNLTVFQPWSIALAVFFVALGLLLDGSRLMHLVHISNEHITLLQAVQVVAYRRRHIAVRIVPELISNFLCAGD